MHTITEAKKGRGIEELLGSLSPEHIEELPKLSPPTAVDYALAQFLHILYDYQEPQFPPSQPNQQGFFQYLSQPDISKIINQNVNVVLSPSEINYFLHATVPFQKQEHYFVGIGPMVSQLIQNSYQKGYNRFLLDCSNVDALSNLSMNVLNGKSRNPLRISLEGALGSGLGFLAQYVVFEFKGSVGENCATQGQYSTFIFHEDVESSTGFPVGFGSHHCVFKARKPETTKKLLTFVASGNQIVRIYPNGAERLMRDYHEQKTR